jgi:hypothetical protein
MKKALLALALCVLAVALLNGPSTSITGGHVNILKANAVRVMRELRVVDRELLNHPFLIELGDALNYSGKPVFVSGEEIVLEVDLTFLGDAAFPRMESYLDYAGMRAYLEVGGMFFESVLEPKGFLTYACTFNVPESVGGAGVLGYRTRDWDRSVEVFVVDDSESLFALGLRDFTL